MKFDQWILTNAELIQQLKVLDLDLEFNPIPWERHTCCWRWSLYKGLGNSALNILRKTVWWSSKPNRTDRPTDRRSKWSKQRSRFYWIHAKRNYRLEANPHCLFITDSISTKWLIMARNWITFVRTWLLANILQSSWLDTCCNHFRMSD